MLLTPGKGKVVCFYSFTSALIGIAISEGYIQSVDDSITDYLPELLDRDPAFANITIRDLLMMSSGIKYTEFPFVNGDDAKTYYFPDLRQLALEDTFIVGEPNEKFHYNNYHPLLLGMIIESSQADLIILRFGESYGEYGGAGGWVDMFYRFASGAGK